jgi:hypothetical protein
MQLLELYRAQVFFQSEEPSSEIEFTVGDMTPDGRQRVRSKIAFVENFGAEYARAFLDRFRTLAFLAAFRVHDMIVSWVLEANGVGASGLFRFAQKKREWSSRWVAGTLLLPPRLTDARILRAFWDIYDHLEPARGALTHEGKVRVLPNGTIEVKDRNNHLHTMDDAAQASYLRLISLMSADLIGSHSPDAHTARICEYDLGRLQHLHSVTGLHTTGFIYDHVTLKIPVANATSIDPYVAEVDFAIYDAAARRTRPDPSSMIYSLEVVAETPTRVLTWRFPPGRVPQGAATLDEADPQYLAFLSVAER